MTNLLYIHLNEFNKDYLIKTAKIYKSKNILQFFKIFKNHLQTYTIDKEQNKNLDPWVQSVSINTGKISAKHKILRIGQGVPKNTTQIWDILSKKKINCGIWGTMNSRYKKSKYLDFYFPDPWNHDARAYPNKLRKILELPKYYAQNYTKPEINKILKYTGLFGNQLLSTSFTKYFFSNIKKFYNLMSESKLNNLFLFCLFDIISIIIFDELVRKNKTKFGLIFLNSIAHFQHNDWDDKKKEKIFFKYLDFIFELLIKLEKNYKSTLFINGFTQKKIKPNFIIRPKNPKIFLQKLNINFIKLEQDMTTGGFIYFKNNEDLKRGKNLLDKLHIKGFKIFKCAIYGKKRIYYKLFLSTYLKITAQNIKKIQPNKFKKIISNEKILETKNDKKYELDLDLLKEFKFIKCTGKHVSQGNCFYKNLNIKKSKKNIHNIEIFNVIKDHFLFNTYN